MLPIPLNPTLFLTLELVDSPEFIRLIVKLACSIGQILA